MKIGEFNPMDRKFWPKNPDPGFSVEKNNKVIADVIKAYEKYRAKKMAQFTDKLRERTDAVASYLAGGRGAGRNRSIEKYFGKTYLAHLRGQNICDQLRREQKRLIKDKEAVYKEKRSQEDLKKRVETGKGVYLIKRTKTDEQKAEESKKKV